MVKEYFEPKNVENWKEIHFKFKNLRGEVVKYEDHFYEVDLTDTIKKTIKETIVHVLMSDSSVHILHTRQILSYKNKIKKYKICKGDRCKTYHCEFVRIIK